MSSSLNSFASAKLNDLEARSLKRELVVTDRLAGAEAAREVDGNPARFVSFCCNDYLNFNHNREVIAASVAAVEAHGAGAGASRLVTGNHPLVDALERELASFKGTEAAVVFGSGYLANAGIVPTLTGPDDLILVDELAHSCMHAGATLSGAKTFRFRHNDMAHLEDLLSAHRSAAQHALILTDGVFSMDGDLAPLPELIVVAKANDAWLMSDDAHGIGVVGGGHGSTFAFGDAVTAADVPLQMGTLSKAIGSTGGYLCASKAVVDLVKTRARTLIYSTGLSPAAAGAALKALELIEAHPEFCRQPLHNALRFTSALSLSPATSPIVPLILGDEVQTLAASDMLQSHGFLVTAIRPPTVPAGTARLRFTFTADHRLEEIDRLIDVVRTHILPKAAAE